MGRRVNVPIPWPLQGTNNTARGGGTQYLVQTPTGALYAFAVDGAGSDLSYWKSTDGGFTWAPGVVIEALSVVGFTIWYDRWSGLSSGLIHVAYTDDFNDDTSYRTVDTENADALSTKTTIFSGATTADTGHMSIVRARGGNVYCKTVIDAGVEGGFFRLLNADVPNGAWASRTVDEAIAASDKMTLLPGFAADNQDLIAIFFDNSATELSRKLYDDSADSWAETSIATSITGLASTTAYPQQSAAVDLANSRIILVAWTAADVANADLRCWTIDESSITETSANVVLNSTDDQGVCGVSLDTQTGDWYVFYIGKSDGSETFPTLANVYMKISTDDGTTWGDETKVSVFTAANRQLVVPPRLYVGAWVMLWYWDGFQKIWLAAVDRAMPRAASLGGIL